jgi:hypothetical protein
VAVPFANRVYSLLESELRKNLTFSFSIVENLSRPTSRQIRPLDRFRIKIWVRNDSALDLRSIRGVIRPTAAAEFSSVAFEVSNLAPRAQREIAVIEATLIEVRPSPLVFNQLATVSVNAQPDLSNFCFRDTSRPLTFVHQTSAKGAREHAPALTTARCVNPLPARPSKPTRRAWSSVIRPIPLSAVPSES